MAFSGKILKICGCLSRFECINLSFVYNSDFRSFLSLFEFSLQGSCILLQQWPSEENLAIFKGFYLKFRGYPLPE